MIATRNKKFLRVKVGDRVLLKPREWFDKNRGKLGPDEPVYRSPYFLREPGYPSINIDMAKYLGQEMTVYGIYNSVSYDGDVFHFAECEYGYSWGTNAIQKVL